MSGSLIGWNSANTYTPSALPAWMTDLNARGIGNGSQYAAPAITPIDIPQGPLTPDAAPQAAQQANVGTYNGVGASSYGGGGEAGGNGVNGGNQGGNPGSVSDFIGGMSRDYTGLVNGLADMVGIDHSMADVSQTANDAAAAAGPGGSNPDSGMGGGPAPGMFRGGIVTRNKLTGANPPGPDDGKVNMKLGEGVLTDAAMKFYGPAIVNKLNGMKVPKSAFR